MSNITVVPADDVRGDITSCKVENQVKQVHKGSPFSLTKTTEYITYDVCNKNVIAAYSVPEFAGFSYFLGGIILLFVIGFVAIATDY